MVAADGETGHAGTSAPSHRQFALAFVVFALLFGQPAVILALALLSPSTATYLVIVAGTALLAVPAARTYLRRGAPVGRLADYVLTLAAIQILLVAGVRLVFAVASPGSVTLQVVQPVIVLASFPVAYHLVFRGTAVTPLGR